MTENQQLELDAPAADVEQMEIVVASVGSTTAPEEVVLPKPSPLFQAILDDHLEAFSALCEDDPSLWDGPLVDPSDPCYSREVQREQQWTAVHVAARHGATRVVGALVQQNPASLDRADALGRTPLSYASEMDEPGIIDLLAELRDTSPAGSAASIDAASRGRGGLTPLMYACENDSRGALAALLGRFPGQLALNLTAYEPIDDTPASEWTCDQLVSYLRRCHTASCKEAALRLQDAKVQGGRFLSMDADDFGTMQLGLKADDVAAILRAQNALRPDSSDSGPSALYLACAKGQAVVVDTLLESVGPDVDLRRRHAGLTPLLVACKGNWTEVVAVLIHRGGDRIDVTELSAGGATCLHIALGFGKRRSEEIVGLLLGCPGVDKIVNVALEPKAYDLEGFWAFEEERTPLEYSGVHNLGDAYLALRAHGAELCDLTAIKTQRAVNGYGGLFSLVFMYMQLSAFPFLVSQVSYSGADGLWGGAFIDIPFGISLNLTSGYIAQFVVFCVAVVALLFGVPLIALRTTHGNVLDSHLPAWVVYPLIYLSFFMLRIGIIPIARTLLRMFACTSTPDGSFTLDADPAITCWEGTHVVFLLLAVPIGAIYLFIAYRLVWLESDVLNLRRVEKKRTRKDGSTHTYYHPVWLDRWADYGEAKRHMGPEQLNFMLPRFDTRLFDAFNLLVTLGASLFSVFVSDNARVQLWAFAFMSLAQFAIVFRFPPFILSTMNAFALSLTGGAILNNWLALFVGLDRLGASGYAGLAALGENAAFGFPALFAVMGLAFFVGTKLPWFQRPSPTLPSLQEVCEIVESRRIAGLPLMMKSASSYEVVRQPTRGS